MEPLSGQNLSFSEWIKKVNKRIAPILTHIINLSFKSKVFPTAWKLAKIIPLFKGGDPFDPKDVDKYALKKGLSMNKQNITIYDARKNNPGKFHESGFTLIELDELPNIKDWRSVPQQNLDAEIINLYCFLGVGLISGVLVTGIIVLIR